MNALDRFSLKGKTAIVTGANGLIGRYHCKALAEAGAVVVATDIGKSGDRAAREAMHKNCLFRSADVTDPVSVRQLMEWTLARTGQIDVLVNNAAINDTFENPSTSLELSRFENYPLEMWKKLIEVNVTGVFICTQIIGSKMAAMGKGSIINIGSTYGLVAPDQSLYVDRGGNQKVFKSAAYPTSKGAVIAFSRFLAAYWGKSGVRVNTLSPGGVDNNQEEYFRAEYARRTPLARMASPDEYMGALIYLASDASAYMTGANLVVDGGFTVW